jgi:hypothetical protein
MILNMNISSPKYLVSDYIYNEEKKEDISNVKKGISSCIFQSLKNSDKFLISDLFPSYIMEIEEEESKTNNNSGKYAFDFILNDFKKSMVFEFEDFYLNRDVLINIVGSKNSSFKKLTSLISQNFNEEKDGFLFLYFFKDANGWNSPSKSIFIDSNNKTFPYQLSHSKKDIENDFNEQLNSIYQDLIKLIFHPKMEMFTIPNSNKKMDHKKCYPYKTPHVFIKLPNNKDNNNKANNKPYFNNLNKK